MSARQMMIHRATIERNFATDDPLGQPGPPDWQIIGIDVPCRVWAGTGGGRRTVIENRQQVTVDMPGAIFPLDTDIDEAGRIRQVTDRRGNELFGMMAIDGVLRRKDHLEVRIRDYG